MRTPRLIRPTTSRVSFLQATITTDEEGNAALDILGPSVTSTVTASVAKQAAGDTFEFSENVLVTFE